MRRTVLWIVGEPGLGKTTLARALLGQPLTLTQKSAPKWTVGPGGCAAGHYTGQAFDGADTIPYSGGQKVLKYWQDILSDTRLTILDGDRLSNFGSIRFFNNQLDLRCVHLVAPHPGVGKARRAARGSRQNETWLKGRVTKARNFATVYFASQDVLTLDARSPPDVLEARVRDFLQRP